MGTIAFFDHTADVGLRLDALSLADLFETAARGLFEYIVVNGDEVRPTFGQRVAIQEQTLDGLLVQWLNELIFQVETRHFLFSKFTIETIGQDDLRLSAWIEGEPIDPSRHILDHEVKAVTRHALTLAETSDGWMAELILDI